MTIDDVGPPADLLRHVVEGIMKEHAADDLEGEETHLGNEVEHPAATVRRLPAAAHRLDRLDHSRKIVPDRVVSEEWLHPPALAAPAVAFGNDQPIAERLPKAVIDDAAFVERPVGLLENLSDEGGMVHEVKVEQPAVVNIVAEVTHEPIEKQCWISGEHPLPIEIRRPRERSSERRLCCVSLHDGGPRRLRGPPEGGDTTGAADTPRRPA